jgi:hypothetical protein
MSRYGYWESDNFRKLKHLTQQSFFKHCLLPDIVKGNVFPAIRGQKVDFYLNGRKVCSFNGAAFQANIAYLAAFQDRPNGEVTEQAFRQLTVCDSFEDGYQQIKNNIRLFEEPESGGVFKLCKSYSCFSEKFSGPIGVLDIELSLAAHEEEQKQDRIDLVLFHLEKRELRFFEAKTFGNKEIWPSRHGVLVVEQIQR